MEKTSLVGLWVARIVAGLVIAISSAYAGTPGFDESGNLTEAGKQLLFKLMKPSLIEAAGGSEFVADPFPLRFMDTGYLRETAGWLLFVNPTFGVVVFLNKDNQSNEMRSFGAVSAVELAEYRGLSDKFVDNVQIRYALFEKAINRLMDAETSSRQAVRSMLDYVSPKRTLSVNRLLISGPILRSMDDEGRTCFSSISEAAASDQAAAAVAKVSPNTPNLSFFAVDLIPGPNQDGVFVMTDDKTRTIYTIFPLRRRADGTCALETPTLLVNTL